MTQDDWNRYRPPALAGYRLGEAMATYSDRAVFRARAEGGESRAAFVWLIESDDDAADTRVNRFLEATFFEHPNLLKVHAAGRTEGDRRFVYVVSEPFEYSLGRGERPRPLTPDTLRPVLRHIAAGLGWLHAQGFVYCALRADSVVWTGTTWKLADFSELRIAEKSAHEETRRLLIRQDLYAPPEAYEGVVSPAWDAWSLGQTIQNLFAQEALATGGNPRVLPPAAGEMVRELADTDPAQRLGMAEFTRRLAEPGAFGALETARGETARVAVPRVPLETPTAEVDAEEEHETVRKKRINLAMAIVLALGGLAILAIQYRPPEDQPVARADSGQTHAAESPRVAKPAAANPDVISGSTPPPQTVSMNPPPADAASEKRQISGLIDRWVDSMRSRDVQRQTACYAPVVDEFFGRRNVSINDVRRAKEKTFESADEARQFSIDDMRFERLDPDRATVSFLKIWNFPGRPFIASAREEMVVRRVADEWKIAGERELSQTARGSGGSGKYDATRFAGNQ
jgi:serine/threonine protein kinase